MKLRDRMTVEQVQKAIDALVEEGILIPMGPNAEGEEEYIHKDHYESYLSKVQN